MPIKDWTNIPDDEWKKLLKRMGMSDQDIKHQEALNKTGFWGKAGAGCLCYAVDKKTFLFDKRSMQVEEGQTWGLFGGAIDEKEANQPLKAALRELREETGYKGKVLSTHLLYLYQHESGFKYYNFLVEIPAEFNPKRTWESDGHKWVPYGHWPAPLHSKVRHMLTVPTVDAYLMELK